MYAHCREAQRALSELKDDDKGQAAKSDRDQLSDLSSQLASEYPDTGGQKKLTKS
jgi:hypothetical protein